MLLRPWIRDEWLMFPVAQNSIAFIDFPKPIG